MQFLGLIGLIIAITLGVTLAIRTPALAPTEVEPGTENAPGLGVINDAKKAATQIERGSVGRTVEIYAGISVAETATTVDLSGRGLPGSLKAEIRQVSNLRELDLSSNQFTGLPAEVGQLTELRVLNLAKNPITGLPHEIGNLTKLQVLDLRGTNYSQFDVEQIRSTLPSTTNILTE